MSFFFFFFFFNDTATTEIYTLSLHDALPIPGSALPRHRYPRGAGHRPCLRAPAPHPRSEEHTSNSSHSQNSYAVFCLKKKTRIYNGTDKPEAVDGLNDQELLHLAE